MTMKTLTLAVVTSAMVTPAFASGPVSTQPAAPITVAPAVPTGTDWTGPSVGIQLGYGDVETSGAAALTGEGALYGLRAYYDYDFGDFIVGAGLQYDGADIDLGGVTTLDSVTRVGVRGGYDFGPSWLYGTAGYAQATTSSGAVGDSDGYFAGLGYELWLTDTITLGTEVLYHEFDDFNLGGLEADATTVGVSMNFRF